MVDFEAITDSLKGLGEGFGRALNSVFGSQNTRVVKRMKPLIDEINSHESWAEALSDEEIRQQTASWKQEVADGRSLDDILPQAFALVRVAAQRTLGLRHYDVQLVGGIAMHGGSIAEMATGEGKTLVATLSAYLNALSSKVFVVTVNDYLAARDSEWMGAVYEFLGLTVGVIQHDQSPPVRLEMYACDVTYGTNSEFGFDYLRDNGMAQTAEEQVQRGHYFAIVDEVDSILIDEARTPLIISGPTMQKQDQRLYSELKPKIQAIVRKQRELCDGYLRDAEKLCAKAKEDGQQVVGKAQFDFRRVGQFIAKVPSQGLPPFLR